MSNQYLGEIRIFTYGFIPRFWAACDGQLLPISQNQALFSLLGTTYGGNGVTTFQLPDMRARVPLHSGSGPGLSPYVIGQRSGSESVTLLATQTPAHNHQVSASTLGPNQASTGGGVWADKPDAYATSAPDIQLPAADLPSTGGQPHSNLAPYLALTFCIAMSGIFPSQN